MCRCGILGKEQLFRSAHGGYNIMNNGVDAVASARGRTADHDDHFRGLDISGKMPFGCMKNAEAQSAPGDNEANDCCDIHLAHPGEGPTR